MLLYHLSVCGEEVWLQVWYAANPDKEKQCEICPEAHLTLEPYLPKS